MLLILLFLRFMYLLGYDIGTSFVKASLVDALTGKSVSSAFMPEREAPIISGQSGWAEQDPESWWTYLIQATQKVLLSSKCQASDIKAIGISYQMHGLVCVDENFHPLRKSIIWCDSRAVPYGNTAFESIGHERCLSTVLNSPANFTAAKLAWVKEHEPQVFDKIKYIMLPGDYIALKLSGVPNTTVSGLSEGVFWDFKNNSLSNDVFSYFGFSQNIIPEIVPTFSIQSVVSHKAAKELGLREGTPISYRAGDQPNNAMSLNVMNAGEIAATAGTSGVVYGVLDHINYDPLNRVNVFAHVNHSNELNRLGVLLCINGTGILNAWVKHNIFNNKLSYDTINEIAAEAPIGSAGLSILPFGNGAERILQNKDTSCSIEGVNFNIHNLAHIARATQEGIVCAFYKGILIMREMGMDINTIHAGNANLFKSKIFRITLASMANVAIKLFETDGAAGAAKGAGIGVGIYNNKDNFSSLELKSETHPDIHNRHKYEDIYNLWNERLVRHLNRIC